MEKVIARRSEKLSNRDFVEKALDFVVKKEKARLDNLQANQAKLERQVEKLLSQSL